ncbi:hypothetical protein ABIE66_004468 [Peribacillus sp. B2I2]
MKKLAVELFVAMDENHASVVPTTMSSAVPFADK